MKAKDLMQGDYITFKDALKDGVVVPVKIVGLGYVGRGVEDEALVEIDGDKSCDIIEIDDECVGIPLTEEILDKNGFDWNRHAFPEDKLYNLEIYIDSQFGVQRTINCYEYSILRIEFVHQLQHALKLCGIEKEIVL